MVPSSSSSRCIAVLILSSSPRLLGSIAYESTGSGNAIGAKVMPAALSASVSLVRVSLSLATAPRSPALISGTFVGVLPCISTRWPSRSGDCWVAFCTVESDLSTPCTTRNSVMRPANWSATVFQTNAAYGAFSSAGRDTRSPLAMAANGRSAGEGR